ncbi:TIR domain-containing protein [Rufibacter sediminis]|uniref:TIR domain-containing protein n=1 Tax=Rufibacter sediminis TaxID=2762756 RepID=A0ABR6VV47_9BACT|nr:TIR domain-containing protein [Rufibacter sediminis]MBC3540772.1 TIR domain-containing protein [Rufibacter sediminis]
MTKIFLSHSSKQKGYVEVIANRLGKAHIVYDAWTFEAGNKTLDEIYQGIDSSGIFVYFISNESLESIWVEKEINKAEEYLKNGNLKKFLPILIDQNIKHSDNRIPQWIKDEYNIKYISKPTKTSDLIKQALRLVSWDLYPKRKQADQLFIGRTQQIKQYEERIYNFDLPTPSSIIISGLNSIGRRKFIKHVLVNSNKIRAHYAPHSIYLDSRSSIEDLIIKLYGLGYSQHSKNLIENLSIKTISEKINIVTELIKELNSNNEIVFIIDNLAIVNREGYLVDWFLPINEVLNSLDALTMCIISQSRTRARNLLKTPSIFAIEIPELEPYERKAFFKSLLDIEGIKLNQEDFKIISNQFSGFPEQIIYTSSLLIHEGKDYVINNPHEVIEYNTEKVAKIIRNHESNQLALQILKILSESEFLSFNILESILKEDFNDAKSLITQFSNEFIIEYLGNTKEYLRLNDSVKDYIQRLGYKLIEKYSSNLQLHAQKAFEDYDIVDRDISDYVISFKEALKFGYQVPKELLIPSHYVNAMRELYNYDRRYKDVIVLADRILQNEDYLDARIIKEIRYWLCLSLIRRRDRRLLEEVQKVDGADHNFLLGFYYRIIGRNEDAIQRFNKVLEDAPNFYRAKRELVQVYLNTEQYEEAFALARDNYYLDKNNPYNLQSYFRCLIKLEGAKQKEELNNLLNGLEKNPHEKAREMYMTAQAQYYAFAENNDASALRITDDAIASFPKNIYPYLTKLELLKRNSNLEEMKKTISEIESKYDSDSDIFSKLPYLSCKCIILIHNGQKEHALRIINKEIKPNFSNTIYQNILATIG